MVAVPIAIFDSDTIPRDRRPELEGGRGCRRQASQKALRRLDSRHSRPPEVRRADHVIPRGGFSVPFDWNATAAEVTERVRAAMED
jgi:hypothetical protein